MLSLVFFNSVHCDSKYDGWCDQKVLMLTLEFNLNGLLGSSSFFYFLFFYHPHHQVDQSGGAFPLETTWLHEPSSFEYFWQLWSAEGEAVCRWSCGRNVIYHIIDIINISICFVCSSNSSLLSLLHVQCGAHNHKLPSGCCFPLQRLRLIKAWKAPVILIKVKTWFET